MPMTHRDEKHRAKAMRRWGDSLQNRSVSNMRRLQRETRCVDNLNRKERALYCRHIEEEKHRAEVICRWVRRAKLKVSRACVGRSFERDASAISIERNLYDGRPCSTRRDLDVAGKVLRRRIISAKADKRILNYTNLVWTKQSRIAHIIERICTEIARGIIFAHSLRLPASMVALRPFRKDWPSGSGYIRSVTDQVLQSLSTRAMK